MRKTRFYSRTYIVILIISLLFSLGCKNYGAKKHYNAGKKLKKQGRYEEAIEEYKKAIELDPEYAKAYYRVGQLYLKLKDEDKAIEYFELSIKKDPSRANNYKYLARAFISKGDYDKAIAICERALSHIDDIKVKNELKELSQKLIEESEQEQQDEEEKDKLDDSSEEIGESSEISDNLTNPEASTTSTE